MHHSKSTRNLAEWLSYIESLHPKSIAMGLDRVKQMIDRLKLHPKFTIITVAGTNGKGSTCAMLEQIYTNAGYQVGCYTSPHLLRYNERVRINKQEANDEAICAAFAAVDAARADTASLDANGDAIALTYFEVGTLAAVWHFMQTGVDVAILEIGLGGRLDAVNAFEPDCSIVTSVDLDHQEYLGDTRESIGFEKAGIYRTSVTAICGDTNPPLSLVTFAHEVKANLKLVQHDFNFTVDGVDSWRYSAGEVDFQLPRPALKGAYQLNNAACAVSAVESLQSSLPVSSDQIASAMLQVSLAGRFQTVSTSPEVILDVAHNPHAARALAENLNVSRASQGQTVAVFAMLADKDMQGVVHAVKDEIDLWYIAGIDNVRGASVEELLAIVSEVDPNARIKTFQNANIAYEQACIDVSENDKIVVFGSFYTVASVMQKL
ncbi:MAG: bifunctional tetrahydrofolate synthase/dihydrofolate synthase [Methylotenera sp.]|uniref:bifunctional tetrahydrofolate synthase/dihydrofolate synthase n=1 Tax=Methylotenera sp. TaxID=2051956 RepID=UPI002488E95D|nr:bifunctional tetrahydrofolate synthase/dihydrofolate synthase [Methylotenera sp.]MDI1307861.1 bifunctional tetrahydrofolate synthase/dihydrofolate synthase [Methylotenera sp.]